MFGFKILGLLSKGPFTQNGFALKNASSGIVRIQRRGDPGAE